MIESVESDPEGSADPKPPGNTGASGKHYITNNLLVDGQEESVDHPP